MCSWSRATGSSAWADETFPGATTLDLGDVTLVPGLIDAHTHVTGQLEGDWVGAPVRETAADIALHGVLYAGRTLRAGFTTIRDVGSGGFADVALMRAIDAGRVTGPRIVPAANAIGITGGHCDATGWKPGVLEADWKQGVADGVDEAIKAVRYSAKHGAKVIKVCATAGVLSFEGPVGAQQLTDQELAAIVGRSPPAWPQGGGARPRRRRHCRRGPGRRGLHRARLA